MTGADGAWWRRGLGLLALVGALGAGALDASAQAAPGPPTSQAAAAPGASLEVSVVTFGQGDFVWERFGHNAIQIDDRASGMRVMWHWGLFDFDQPNFVGRFLTGDTRYWMEGFDPDDMLRAYESYDRTITVQRLAMTPAQKQALLEFLRWNEQDANKYYRYDYYRDNCSTRLRDALDRALGGALARAMVPRVTPHTHRSESLRLVDAMPLTQAGMHVALGHPADVPMTAWEAAFVPMRLRDALREIRVADATGRPVSLVADERVVYQARRADEATAAPGLVVRFLVIGVLLAALIAVLGRWALGGTRGARAAFGTLGGLWGLVSGAVGVLVLLAWTTTRHDFWDRNENLFQLGPQALPLLALVPLALLRPARAAQARNWAVVVLGISVLGLVLKVLPGFRQPNLAVIALALPVHAALAWALAQLARRSRASA